MPDFMEKYGHTAETYLRAAKRRARATGYDARKLSFATDGVHKLTYVDPDGKKKHFGRIGYGDYILWTKARPGNFARTKRHRFRVSHRAIPDSGKYSPNQLAINILW